MPKDPNRRVYKRLLNKIQRVAPKIESSLQGRRDPDYEEFALFDLTSDLRLAVGQRQGSWYAEWVKALPDGSARLIERINVTIPPGIEPARIVAGIMAERIRQLRSDVTQPDEVRSYDFFTFASLGKYFDEEMILRR